MKYINFSQLRSFHAVSKTGSITKASKLLSVSQPTITKQLQLIESYYKVNLINRHARGITLTDLGKKLYEITLSIFDLEEEAINLFSSNLNVHKGTLVTGTSGSYFIMKLVKEFKKLHPGIQLKIISANSNSILDKINDYDIDIAVIGKPIKKNFKPNIYSIPYLKQKIVIIAGPGHRFYNKSTVKLKDLETLDISENHLSTLPKEIGGLKNLRHLNLRNNRPLKILPPEIGSLIQVQYLGFEGSKLSKIPNTIGGCKNLIKIVGNACKIEAIPFEIGKCTELREINLSYNKIDSIPSEIGELNSLKTISLGGNHIRKLPNSFEKLSKLRFCGLGHNQFKTFPNPVLRLQKVQTLWLHENEFNEVPIDLANMKSLIYFLVDEPELNSENVEKIKELNPQIRFIDED